MEAFVDSLHFRDISKKNEIPNVSGIYVLRNTKNGKIYVGRSIHIKTRLKEHFQPDFEKYNGKKLANAKKKYGIDSFEFAIIEYCDESVLLEREEYYLNALSPFGDCGYNLRASKDSSVGIFVMEQEQKDKISKSLKKYYEDKENPFAGKTHSEETKTMIRQNIRNSDGTLKADYFSEEYRTKRSIQSKRDNTIRRIDGWIAENGHPREKSVEKLDKTTGEVLGAYRSTVEAFASLGREKGSRTAITNCLIGLSKTAYGFKWRFKE